MTDENRDKGFNELILLESQLRHTGEYDKALEALDRLIELDPSYSPAYTNKAGVLAVQGRFEAAIPMLKKALALEPEDGIALNNLGRCYHEIGQPDKAIPLLREALVAGYTHEGVRYNLGLALLSVGQLDEALDEWERVLRVNPLYMKLVLLLQKLGRATGTVRAEGEIGKSTIQRIRTAMKRCQMTLIRQETGSGMTLLITNEYGIVSTLRI